MLLGVGKSSKDQGSIQRANFLLACFIRKGFIIVFSVSQNLWRQEGPKKTSSKSDLQGLILELHERAKMLQLLPHEPVGKAL